jgi:hypothetical protein
MTLPALAVPRTAPDARLAVPAERPGHPGCYWNWERAAWVACASVPQPRPPRD